VVELVERVGGVRGQELAQLSARAEQPGLDRADPDLEDGGELVGIELLPVVPTTASRKA